PAPLHNNLGHISPRVGEYHTPQHPAGIRKVSKFRLRTTVRSRSRPKRNGTGVSRCLGEVRHFKDRRATVACACGAGVTADAARRATARIVDRYPRIPRVAIHNDAIPGPEGSGGTPPGRTGVASGSSGDGEASGSGSD